MKIAMLAPFEERVPPVKYGGTEVIVYTLAEELVKLGHEVSLFASGDSVTSAGLVPVVPKAFGSAASKRLREALTYKALTKVVQRFGDESYDIIHNHIGWQFLLFRDFIKSPVLTTIHWALDNPVEKLMYQMHGDMPYASISHSQQKPLPDLNYVDVAYHGLHIEDFPFSAKSQDYLAFLGRFSPVKGPLEAIEIAKKTGHRLLMAAKINDFERVFYERRIKPLIDGKQIVYLGEIEPEQRADLLGGAKALLSPISWEEPFGLTNIEALACGTPVIAMARGALPEVMSRDDSKIGFLCNNVSEMIEAVGRLSEINRHDCRAYAMRHFCGSAMAHRYVKLYEKVIAEHAGAPA